MTKVDDEPLVERKKSLRMFAKVLFFLQKRRLFFFLRERGESREENEMEERKVDDQKKKKKKVFASQSPYLNSCSKSQRLDCSFVVIYRPLLQLVRP